MLLTVIFKQQGAAQCAVEPERSDGEARSAGLINHAVFFRLSRITQKFCDHDHAEYLLI